MHFEDGGVQCVRGRGEKVRAGVDHNDKGQRRDVSRECEHFVNVSMLLLLVQKLLLLLLQAV